MLLSINVLIITILVYRLVCAVEKNSIRLNKLEDSYNKIEY